MTVLKSNKRNIMPTEKHMNIFRLSAKKNIRNTISKTFWQTISAIHTKKWFLFLHPKTN
jgi:phage antirepressor YoqD-like protein